jgi:CDP-diglyceride synthetase
MTILGLLVGVVLAIVILWAINTYLPTDPPLRLIANIVVIVVLLIVLLSVFGVLERLHTPVMRRP